MFGLVWFLCIVFTLVIASTKKFGLWKWFFFSLFTGPLALILVFLFPSEEIKEVPVVPPGQVSRETLIREFSGLKEELRYLNNRFSNLEAKLGRLSGEELDKSEPAPVPEQRYQPVPQPQYQPNPELETAEIPVKNKEEKNLEVDLGKFWLNKIGIILFALGVGFLITYTFAHVGPAAKIFCGYLVGLALFAAGLKMEPSEKFMNYGRVLLGGAWAIIYFTTYAMYHFEASRVIQSQNLDQFLLILVAFGMIGHSLRYRSQTLAGIALFIGYVTSCLGDVSRFTLISSGILAISALVLVYRLQWLRFVFVGIILTYLTHFAWVIKQISLSRVPVSILNVENVYFLLDAGFLLIYWVLFCLASHTLKNEKEDPSFLKISAANFSNFILFFFMLFPKLYYFYPDLKFKVVLGFGFIYIILAALMEKAKRTNMAVSDTIIAVFLITLAVPLKFIPYHTSVVWLIELPFLLFIGFIFRRRAYRYMAFALMLVLFIRFLLGQWQSLDALKIFSLTVSWRAFITMLGFISTAVCFVLYRIFIERSGSQDPDGVLKNFYSGFCVTFLTMYLWEAMNPLWIALALSLASLAVFSLGVFWNDKYLRGYSLAVWACAALRFLWFGCDANVNELLKMILVYGPAVCPLIGYAMYRRLIKKGEVSYPEATARKLLFFLSAGLLVYAIIVYVRHIWVTLTLMMMGLGILFWGVISAERHLRVCSLIVLIIAAVRFGVLDSYASVSGVFKWLLIFSKLAAAYAAYFIYRELPKRIQLDDSEKRLIDPVFYCATFLAMLAIFKYVAGSWVSVSLGAVGVVLFAAGFLIEERVLRRGGFIIFAITLARVGFVDIAGLAIIYKIISFIVIGILFLGVSFIYTRFMTEKPKKG